MPWVSLDFWPRSWILLDLPSTWTYEKASTSTPMPFIWHLPSESSTDCIAWMKSDIDSTSGHFWTFCGVWELNHQIPTFVGGAAATFHGIQQKSSDLVIGGRVVFLLCCLILDTMGCMKSCTALGISGSRLSASFLGFISQGWATVKISDQLSKNGIAKVPEIHNTL